MKFRLSIALLAMSLSFFVNADSAPADVKTVMAEKGKVLLTESFAKELDPEWKKVKGTWMHVDNGIKGTEKAEDMHAAVMRHELKFHNIVAKYSFRFDGGKATAFSLNDSKGHVCRASITSTQFSINKDKSNAKSEEKGQVLDKTAMAFVPGQWYTITVELCGKDFVATIDDKRLVGTHAGIDVDKTNFGFPISGNGITLKDLTIWEATPKADWEQTKATLMTGKVKAAK